MTPFFFLLLLAGARLTAGECQNSMQLEVWVPKEVGNPLLNVAVEPEPGNKADWQYYKDLAAPTDTHRKAGTVFWYPGTDKEKDIHLYNTETTVRLSDMNATVTETNTTCTLSLADGADQPCPEESLNWYIGVGTDIGDKPGWKDVKLECMGELDLRGDIFGEST